MASKRRPEPELRCAGVLDGRNIPALNTTLRESGVDDNDRQEILKFASLLDAKRRAEKGGDHGE